MRVLVIGVSGLIGSAIASRLSADGHQVTGVARHPDRLPGVTCIAMDISQTNPGSWQPLLETIDAVINCAGTLQDSPTESTEGVHVHGIAALYEACARANVRRVIHFSALGADRQASPFGRSKLRGEQELMKRPLDWIILRPSVVIGRSAYGGSALLRGLAALPLLPVMPRTAELQPILLDDVVEVVIALLKPDAPTRQMIELVGPRRYRFDELVGVFRQWMRWPPAASFAVPDGLAHIAYRLGDMAAWLGWKSALRTTAEREMQFGAVGDPAQLQSAASIKARSLEASMAREPASVQERWFARLFLLKALIFGVFGAFWIATGLISLGPGWEIGTAYVREGGLSQTMAAAATIAGALSDIVIGLAILYRPTTRYGLYAALLISVTYSIIGTILVPRLWIDPLGPMLKIWPVMMLNLVALAIVDDR